MTLSEDGLRPVRERTEIIQASINLFLILVHHHLFEVEKTLHSTLKSEKSAFSPFVSMAIKSTFFCKRRLTQLHRSHQK